MLARVPEVGEVVECHGYRFEILGVAETRITDVAIPPADTRRSGARS